MVGIDLIEAYMHIIDVVGGTKVYSENPMAIDEVTEDYIITQLEGFFEGLDIGKTVVTEDSKMREIMASEDFKTFSLKVADAFIDIMEKCLDVKSCDLLCVLFQRGGKEYTAALKLNYKPSFSHMVAMEENAITNNLIVHQTTLPPKSQKVEEGFLLDLHGGEAYIKDKQITLDERKCAYISECVFGIQKPVTPKRAINDITKAAEKVVEKYKDNPMVETAKVRAVVESVIDNYGYVDAAVICDKCFDTEAEKEAFNQAVSQKGVDVAPWDVPESQRSKIKRTQKIKTSSGVEIVVPYAYMAREENLEITNHEDGSISIKLMNLGELL